MHLRQDTSLTSTPCGHFEPVYLLQVSKIDDENVASLNYLVLGYSNVCVPCVHHHFEQSQGRYFDVLKKVRIFRPWFGRQDGLMLVTVKFVDFFLRSYLISHLPGFHSSFGLAAWAWARGGRHADFLLRYNRPQNPVLKNINLMRIFRLYLSLNFQISKSVISSLVFLANAARRNKLSAEPALRITKLRNNKTILEHSLRFYHETFSVL